MINLQQHLKASDTAPALSQLIQTIGEACKDIALALQGGAMAGVLGSAEAAFEMTLEYGLRGVGIECPKLEQDVVGGVLDESDTLFN